MQKLDGNGVANEGLVNIKLCWVSARHRSINPEVGSTAVLLKANRVQVHWIWVVNG